MGVSESNIYRHRSSQTVRNVACPFCTEETEMELGSTFLFVRMFSVHPLKYKYLLCIASVHITRTHFKRVVSFSRYLNVGKFLVWASALCICFYINPALLNGSTQFHYCTDSNPGTGADDAFVLKRGVWRNATWPLHSRPAIAASARHFQICFLP